MFNFNVLVYLKITIAVIEYVPANAAAKYIEFYHQLLQSISLFIFFTILSILYFLHAEKRLHKF